MIDCHALAPNNGFKLFTGLGIASGNISPSTRSLSAPLWATRRWMRIASISVASSVPDRCNKSYFGLISGYLIGSAERNEILTRLFGCLRVEYMVMPGFWLRKQ